MITDQMATEFKLFTLTSAAGKTVDKFWISHGYGGVAEYAIALDESYITPDVLPCPNYPVFLQGVGQPFNHKPFETIANRCIARKAETGSTQRCEIATVDGKRCWIYQIRWPSQVPGANLAGAFARNTQYTMKIVAKCISGGANTSTWIHFDHENGQQPFIRVQASQTTWGTFELTSLANSSVERIHFGWDDAASVWAIALDESYITPALLPCANNPPSSADYGRLTVKAPGKNLLNLTQVKAEIPGGATVSNVSANSITVTKPNENAAINWRGYLIDVLPHAQYTLSFVAQRLSGTTANGPGSVAIYSGDRGTTALGGWMAAVNSNGSAKLTFDSGANNQIWLVFYAQVVTTAASIGPSSIKYSNIQIEYGNTATAYTPYVPGTSRYYNLQKPLLALPNGPHDELDVARGKIIRRVAVVEFDGTEEWSWHTKPEGYKYTYCQECTKTAGKFVGWVPSYCTHLPYNDTAWNTDVIGWAYNGTAVTQWFGARVPFDTLDEWKAFLAAQKAAGTPMQALFERKEPAEEDVQPAFVAMGYVKPACDLLPLPAPAGNVYTTDQLMPDVVVTLLTNKRLSRAFNADTANMATLASKAGYASSAWRAQNETGPIYKADCTYSNGRFEVSATVCEFAPDVYQFLTVMPIAYTDGDVATLYRSYWSEDGKWHSDMTWYPEPTYELINPNFEANEPVILCFKGNKCWVISGSGGGGERIPDKPSSYVYDSVHVAAFNEVISSASKIKPGWNKFYLIGDGGSGGRGGTNPQNHGGAGGGAGATGAVAIHEAYVRAGDTVSLVRTSSQWELNINWQKVCAGHGSSGGSASSMSPGSGGSGRAATGGNISNVGGVSGGSGIYSVDDISWGGDAGCQTACVYTNAPGAKGGGVVTGYNGNGLPGASGRYSTTPPVMLGTAGGGGGGPNGPDAGNSGGAGGAGASGGLVVERGPSGASRVAAMATYDAQLMTAEDTISAHDALLADTETTQAAYDEHLAAAEQSITAHAGILKEAEESSNGSTNN